MDRSGELAATVVGVLLADSSATLGFVLPSAMAKDVTVSETKHVCVLINVWETQAQDADKAQASAKCFSL